MCVLDPTGYFCVDEFRAAQDVHAARWLQNRIVWKYTVESVVGDGWPAYCRVFHPAVRRAGDLFESVRWREVAEAYGKLMHPGAEWGALIGSDSFSPRSEMPGLWEDAPSVGRLPLTVAFTLASTLAEWTRTPELIWCASWSGWGTASKAPRFNLPGREMALFSASCPSFPTDDVSDNYVNLWWPDDRSWCVGTDVDLRTTYVGGSDGAIDAVVRNDALEALTVHAAQSVTADGDSVNPRPPTSPM